MKAASYHFYYNIDVFIQMCNVNDSDVAKVDMASQTHWFDEAVIYRVFSGIEDVNTLDLISKQILAYHSYYMSREDIHVGSRNEYGIFTPYHADFAQWLEQIKKRMLAERSAWVHLNTTQNELLEYLTREKDVLGTETNLTKTAKTNTKDELREIPLNIQKMICLMEDSRVKDFTRIMHEDIYTWVVNHKSQYWDLVYLELMETGLLRVGTTRKGFSRMVAHFTGIKQATVYNNMMKSYTHGKTVEWYRKQPDSSEAQRVGREIKKLLSPLI